MEFKKYGEKITIPKDAFIDDRPIDPKNPEYELIKCNIDQRIIAKFMGWPLAGRMVIHSTILDRWMPIGPEFLIDP